MEVELVVDAHAVLGEGPIWNPVTEHLVWVDIMRSEVHEFDPITNIDSVIQIGRHVGTVVPRQCGGLVCAVDDGFVAVDDDGRVTRLAHVEADIPTNRMNDGKCDSSGRLWAGTMPYDTVSPGVGALYRLDPDLSVHTMLRGITVSNGISWSLDDTLMYYIDSPTRHVDVFDFDAALGTISNRRVLIDMTGEIGVPDGMTVDAEGYLWVAIAGGGQVRRYAPDGRRDRVIKFPASLTSACAFGGPHLTDLYVTSISLSLSSHDLEKQPHAGGLFRTRPGPRGLPSKAFSG